MRLTRFSRRKVRELVGHGVLPAIRTAGQSYRFRRAAVEEFMAAVEAGTLDLAVGHRARYVRRRAAQDSAAAT